MRGEMRVGWVGVRGMSLTSSSALPEASAQRVHPSWTHHPNRPSQSINTSSITDNVIVHQGRHQKFNGVCLGRVEAGVKC